MVRKLVYGVGINDVYDISFTKPFPKYYHVWTDMLRRCYDPKWKKNKPTYYDCNLDKKWIYLSTFREWFNENYIEEYQLDKDLLFPGNKIYGPEKCVFVPHYINNLILFCNQRRGKYLLGVCYRNNCGKNPYQSRCNNEKGKSTSKYFLTPEEAHFWYLEQKINVINEYLQEGHSDKIKEGLNRWKQLFQYHIDNQIIFDPNNIMYNL